MLDKDRLEEYLRASKVAFETHHHPQAFTAQEVAAAEHVPGRMLAKVVLIAVGDKHAMAVVPAPAHVDLDKAAREFGGERARLASEDEFGPMFPGCDLGAMPPFGNGALYDVPLCVDRTLADQESIAFAAATHTDTIHMRYADFERLVKPAVGDLAAG